MRPWLDSPVSGHDDTDGELMSASTTRQREEVMGAIARLVGTDQEDLAQRLLEHVATEDLAERPAEVMAGLVTTMRELAEHRDPEQTLIRVFNPDTGEHGWTTPHTIVQVCTDDMPFLVDSVRTRSEEHTSEPQSRG